MSDYFAFPYWWDQFADDMSLDPVVAMLLQVRDEALEDYVNNLSIAVADENIQDIVGAMVVNSATVTWTYDDGPGTLSATATAVTAAEDIQDVVGAMVSGNTETGIAVTYDDGDGTLDFVVFAPAHAGIVKWGV